ncbi:bis(5'-nucleosyl)-tetraphosphatase PrpE [Sporolactobacillus sp. THM7-7]|nr:bis(5'-nucleosyl)-tetraphosphatase PrpE [Sporolactobacillus sp. THM7-7]
MDEKYDVIGDVHGCFHEFKNLTVRLGYDWASGLPVHPDGREIVFVGDITDRGPESLTMIDVTAGLVEKGFGRYIPGNHCDKLYRWMIGRPVQVSHGLECTVRDLNTLPLKKRSDIMQTFIRLYEQSPLYLILDDGKLVVCHAGIRGEDIGRPVGKRLRSLLLYGDTTGKTDAHGRPERRDWAKNYHGSSLIVYGHTPVGKPRWKNRTVNIDTGCVFGGSLTALRYPEEETVSAVSSMPFTADSFRSFSD